MLFVDGGFGLVVLGLWLFCIFDVITSDPADVRNLPKMAWLFIVLFFFDLGSIAWLVAGHNWSKGPARPRAYERDTRYSEYNRPGRFAATNPDDDDAFLRQVRERAQQQREEYRRRHPDGYQES